MIERMPPTVMFILPASYNRAGKHRPAMVTDFDKDLLTANLVVFVQPRDVEQDKNVAETIYIPDVPMTMDGSPGCWYHVGMKFKVPFKEPPPPEPTLPGEEIPGSSTLEVDNDPPSGAD